MTLRRALLFRNIAWAIVIFVLCTFPPNIAPFLPVTTYHADKLAHFFLFFVMNLFLYGELRLYTRLRPAWVCVLSILCCIVYGGVIEILQETYFHRNGEWLDLLADGVGAIAGSLAYLTFERRRRSKGKM
ncbi:MAG: VanZ family protein [Odoribacteraceae bacterium]|jgi:VanZ family protein|nr:VanZ family protein [Odoribacteraceae bacterium]